MPPGPGGRPSPVVFRKNSETRTTGLAISPATAAALADFDKSASLAARGLTAVRGPRDPANYSAVTLLRAPAVTASKVR